MVVNPSGSLEHLLAANRPWILQRCLAKLDNRLPEAEGYQRTSATLVKILALVHEQLVRALQSAEDMETRRQSRESLSTLPGRLIPSILENIAGVDSPQFLLQGLYILRDLYLELLQTWEITPASDSPQPQKDLYQQWIWTYFDQIELAYYRQVMGTRHQPMPVLDCPLVDGPAEPKQECSHGAVANLPVAIYRCRADQFWTMNLITEGIQKLTGYAAADFIDNARLSFESLIYSEDRDRIRQQVYAALADHLPFRVEYRYITAAQETRWMADQGQGYWDAAGNLQFVDGLLIDITDHKQAEEQLKLLSEASEQSPASIIVTDNRGYIQYVNPKFESVTGYSRAEVQGKTPKILKTGHTPPAQYRQLWDTITSGKTWNGEFLNRKKNGELFWETASISPVKDLNGQITHFVAVKEDITVHKETAEMLAYQAHYDLLTDLPNRALAIDHLKLAISQAERDQEYVALLLIDLDNFKSINESIGHDVGDLLLRHVADRLRRQIQQGDTLARLGGDEFLIILQGLKDLEKVLPFGHQLLATIEEPYLLKNIEYYTSASIGVATYPLDSDSSSILLRNADIALYNAKSSGRKNIKFFESGMNLNAQRRHQVANQLRRALEFEEFSLVYQPLMDLKRRCITGAEALLRWQNPTLGAVSPVEFIPVAEETGLILPIGEWVINEACKQVSQWQEFLGDTFGLAINLSPRQFKTSRLADIIAAALERYQVPPHRLELEITESLLLDDVPATKTLMQQLKDMGLRLSIDDFGTGYSALSYLRRFSLDVLKIDRSFITDLPDDKDLGTLVRAIILMAHELGLKVIAEGIETQEQLNFLKTQGCHYGQGYWFCRPLPSEDFFSYALKGMACQG